MLRIAKLIGIFSGDSKSACYPFSLYFQAEFLVYLPSADFSVWSKFIRGNSFAYGFLPFFPLSLLKQYFAEICFRKQWGFHYTVIICFFKINTFSLIFLSMLIWKLFKVFRLILEIKQNSAMYYSNKLVALGGTKSKWGPYT